MLPEDRARLDAALASRAGGDRASESVFDNEAGSSSAHAAPTDTTFFGVPPSTEGLTEQAAPSTHGLIDQSADVRRSDSPQLGDYSPIASDINWDDFAGLLTPAATPTTQFAESSSATYAPTANDPPSIHQSVSNVGTASVVSPQATGAAPLASSRTSRSMDSPSLSELFGRLTPIADLNTPSIPGRSLSGATRWSQIASMAEQSRGSGTTGFNSGAKRTPGRRPSPSLAGTSHGTQSNNTASVPQGFQTAWEGLQIHAEHLHSIADLKDYSDVSEDDLRKWFHENGDRIELTTLGKQYLAAHQNH
jgi:hypothetical protein